MAFSRSGFGLPEGEFRANRPWLSRNTRGPALAYLLVRVNVSARGPGVLDLLFLPPSQKRLRRRDCLQAILAFPLVHGIGALPGWLRRMLAVHIVPNFICTAMPRYDPLRPNAWINHNQRT